MKIFMGERENFFHFGNYNFRYRRTTFRHNFFVKQNHFFLSVQIIRFEHHRTIFFVVAVVVCSQFFMHF